MITINYTGGNQKVIDGANSANKILQNPVFFNLISQHKSFDYTTNGITPSQIADFIQKASFQMTVNLILVPFSKECAADNYSDPRTILINRWYLWKRSVDFNDACDSMIHECVHAVDASISTPDQFPQFGHGDQSCVGKGNSAPYWIGCLAEMLSEYPGKVITDDDVNMQSQKDCG